jgi:hypothetical protein
MWIWAACRFKQKRVSKKERAAQELLRFQNSAEEDARFAGGKKVTAKSEWLCS